MRTTVDDPCLDFVVARLAEDRRDDKPILIWESRRAVSGIEAQDRPLKFEEWLEGHMRRKREWEIEESQQVDAVLVEKHRVRAFAWVEGKVTETEFPSIVDEGFHEWLRALAAKP